MPPSSRARVRFRRLVCVVEGKGDVLAFPALCARVLDRIGAARWVVDQAPVRHPRSQLVDQRVPSPGRPPRQDSLMAAVELAARRPADAVLVVCDSDDDCPASWGPQATSLISKRLAGAGVMVVREYESWLLASIVRAPKLDGRLIEDIRDAKKRLSQYISGYKPSVHQLRATRSLDIDVVRAASRSFDKFVRTLGDITGAGAGVRPLIA
jgi:hypothetical protein